MGLTYMRGDELIQDEMLSYASLEQRVLVDHRLRGIRNLADALWGYLSQEFDRLYKVSGRSSIAAEYILRVLLLQVLFSVRSERLPVE